MDNSDGNYKNGNDSVLWREKEKNVFPFPTWSLIT